MAVRKRAKGVELVMDEGKSPTGTLLRGDGCAKRGEGQSQGRRGSERKSSSKTLGRGALVRLSLPFPLDLWRGAKQRQAESD